uniref:Uncharacterized protein n=1 Tax=Rhizophora mucronata TaxID=61149 RepID=A0A2P2IT52_RHIMU
MGSKPSRNELDQNPKKFWKQKRRWVFVCFRVYENSRAPAIK